MPLRQLPTIVMSTYVQLNQCSAVCSSSGVSECPRRRYVYSCPTQSVCPLSNSTSVLLVHGRITHNDDTAITVRAAGVRGSFISNLVLYLDTETMYPACIPNVFYVYPLDGVCEPGYIGIHSGYTLEYMRLLEGETDSVSYKYVCILKRNHIRDTCKINRNTFRIHVYLNTSGIHAEYIKIQAGY